MRTEIAPGQTSDYLDFDLIMADGLPEPPDLLADRSYDSDSVRKTMGARRVLPVILIRKTAQVAGDRGLYPLPTAQFRRFLPQQAEKRPPRRHTLRQDPEIFPDFIDITSIRLWLRHLST